MAQAVTLAPGADGRKVVIDAGAVIKNQRLERLGSELWTTSGVVAEIKDPNARALLGTLPIELKVREPTAQDIAYTKQFAKGTGDFGFLSQNDLELIALTVQLHRESGGKLKDKPEPLSHQDASLAAPVFDWAPQRADAPPSGSVSGGGGSWTDFKPAARRSKAAMRKAAEAAWVDDEAIPEAAAKDEEEEAAPEKSEEKEQESKQQEGKEEEAAEEGEPQQPEETTTEAKEEGQQAAASSSAPRAEAIDTTAEGEGSDLEPESELDSDEDGSSAGEWVTPENVHRFGVGVEADIEVKITCATADYSVQNVLLQMGITPLTFDGYAVRTVKLWGLYCRACFAFTRDTEKVFCPKCGHDTLVRVPIVVDKDGKATALNAGRPLRRKGTVYSIPKPTMGRGWKPIFAEDEVRIGGRDREVRRLNKLADKEKAARDPFNADTARSWHQRGTTSTGKMLTGAGVKIQAGYGRANPNANNFGGFKNKSKKR
mmetsp:Transcript_22737/g.48278  ORF Transcript_22737/g.48278 Transcript_22737/m.48278 type:complete len:486 (-) Transcript_22737:186-1643(-)|eukprot:CAMPEP_0206481602 /NCGR_PEP_ID=MMETSP0324_2-20121206/38259_1 /ASSEMBLY_ACC=CAM_ASM_000836 /TAXON_ID=2866 /ORGANISM="Crypthecodinium cohnii, Strain Seligo" /LENGTH=485 /DNA_ID=CAMNT_0053959155 /DNA_START=22 /DNA_END=1479 /DNA_ORIENTATION=+